MSNITAAALIAPALGKQKCLQHKFGGDCGPVADIASVDAIVSMGRRQKTFAIGEEHRRQLAADNDGRRYQTATSH